MAKTTKPEVTETSVLEGLAGRLDVMAAEATALGEDRVAQMIGRAAKSTRHAEKQKANRVKKVGSIVIGLKEKGMTDAEIVAQLLK